MLNIYDMVSFGMPLVLDMLLGFGKAFFGYFHIYVLVHVVRFVMVLLLASGRTHGFLGYLIFLLDLERLLIPNGLRSM